MKFEATYTQTDTEYTETFSINSTNLYENEIWDKAIRRALAECKHRSVKLKGLHIVES